MTWHKIMGHMGPRQKVQVHWDRKGSNPIINLIKSNGVGVVTLQHQRSITVTKSMFSHLNIHKRTWTCPVGRNYY